MLHLSKSLKIGILIVLFGLLTMPSESLQAQATNPIYWRYDAPGRLSELMNVDINQDHVGEFLVVAEDTLLMLVGADGRPLWETPYQSQESIQVITTADLVDRIPNKNEIIVGTSNHIQMLDANGNELWQRPLRSVPLAISEYVSTDLDSTDILVAMSDGGLMRFNNQGQIVTEYHFSDSPAQVASPLLAVADLKKDGNLEIIFSYLSDAGFSKLVVMNEAGEALWERSNSGSVRAMELIEFDDSKPLEIALVTTLDRVYLYTSSGDRRWPFRTPNKPITAMIAAQIGEDVALVIGTETGTVMAYDAKGRRYWTQNLDQTASRPILAISAVEIEPSTGNQPVFAVLLGAYPGTSDSADIILLDKDGRQLEPLFANADLAGLSRIVDINNDGLAELVLAGFATLELFNPGVGAREYFEQWNYRLGAKPQSVLIRDIDLDGSQEILVGTEDGMLHAVRSDGTVLWTLELGGIVSNLDLVSSGLEQLPSIIAVHNSIQSGQENVPLPQGQITMIRPDGRPHAVLPFEAPIASTMIEDINQSGPPELLVGTTDGKIDAYSMKGVRIWTATLNASVEQLMLVESARGSEIFAGTATNTIFRLNNKGSAIARVTSFLNNITGIAQLTQEEKVLPRLIVGLGDGTLHSISTRGIQFWELAMAGSAAEMVTGGNSLYISTDEQEFIDINFDGETIWRVDDFGRASSIFWGDLDGDIKADLAVGDRNGLIRLLTADEGEVWDNLNVGSEVFHLNALRRLPGSPAELVAVTDNGILQLFNSVSNTPPMLVNPQVEVEQGNYSLAISVIDVENDPVSVKLELFDESADRWFDAGQRVASSGNDSLFWSIDPPGDAQEVKYRFIFDDGTHRGALEPAPGPPPLTSSSLVTSISLGFVALFIIAGGTAYFYRQSGSPPARVRRFYQRVQQEPESTLNRLEAEYYHTGGSPDFLLNLANRARREGDEVLASLTDGLYLLSAQPGSAFPIIVDALDAAEAISPPWDQLEIWKATYDVGEALFSAPSITELSLLRPQLLDLVYFRHKIEYPSESIEELLPVITIIRDSERVELANDKIIYLNETIGLLRQIKYRSRYWPIRIDNVLTQAVIDRWVGLARSAIEEIEGRAQIVTELITQSLVPESQTVVALSIANVGRATADLVQVELQESEDYNILSQPQVLPILSPGRKRQLQFLVEPQDTDSFRTVFSISYSEGNGEIRKIAFADRVSFLPQKSSFEPIINPYSPGMPLRENSQVFFGREDLFEFVADNIGRTGQRNVLTLIGQRRTGKTSALLQLDKRLPDDIYSIYIDCQSLGVTPGMPSLLHDLAWNIADALVLKGFELKVPDPAWWQVDTTGKFQRHFLKLVKETLPANTTLLLVFDEFEAFENLVYDGVLPATLFTYFRHLMQHEEDLAFIFSGTHRLEEINADYWSVLFNAALYKHIGFLSDTAAIHLIREPVAPNLVYDDLAIDKILRVTAGHPYFLQLVCYTLVNRANKQGTGYITISDVNSALDEMLRLGEVHFAYLWQRSSHAERALLMACSRMSEADVPFKPADLVQRLREYNIYLEPSSVTLALNRLVEHEIFKEVSVEGSSLYALHIGLVGQWVHQNKSFSRLYASRESSSRSIEHLQ